MSRATWIIAGAFASLGLVGCNSSSAPPPAAPAEQAAAPGDPGAGMPGMEMPGGEAATAAPPKAAPRDIVAYVPDNVTVVVGGRPAALVNSKNALAASVLRQLAPLVQRLSGAELSIQGVERFWCAANADHSERVVCLATKDKLNSDKVLAAFGISTKDKTADASKIQTLPAAPDLGVMLLDAQTLFFGRKSTLEAALRKTNAPSVKRGLDALRFAESDFWVAGDAATGEALLKRGLPLVGPVAVNSKQLQGFAVAISLEGTAQPGAGPDLNMTLPGQEGAANPADPLSNAPDGAGGPQPNPTETTTPDKTVGVMIVAGLAFATEPIAESTRKTLEKSLQEAAAGVTLRASSSGQTNRGQPGGGYDPARGSGTPGNEAAGLPNPGQEGAGNTPLDPNLAGGGGLSGLNLNSLPDPLKIKIFAKRPSPRLRPVVPPEPAAAPAGGDAAGAGMVAGGTSTPGMSHAGGTPMPGAEVPPAGSAPGTYAPEGSGSYGGGLGGAQAASAWVRSKGPSLQFAYRYDDWDETLSVAGELLYALGDSATPNLSRTFSAFQSVQAATPGLKGVTLLALGPASGGYSWLTSLLPHLGYADVHALLNQQEPWSSEQNLLVARQIIPEFLNPRDRRVRWRGGAYDGLGLTHFAGMAGVEDQPGVVAGRLPRTDPRAGIFGYDEIARPEAITDGQVHTIAIVGTGRLAGPWIQGGGATVRGAREPFFAGSTGFDSAGLSEPGTLAVFADGSVRVVSGKIDPSVFKAMCTMHGNDQVDLKAVEGQGGIRSAP